MYAVTSNPFVSRTRATFRSAEFGFFGVVVYTRVHTPRFCGHASIAGTLLRATCHFRGLRISWFIVGILTDLFKQNSRPAPFLRWSGGACTRFLNAPLAGTPSHALDQAASRWLPTASPRKSNIVEWSGRVKPLHGGGTSVDLPDPPAVLYLSLTLEASDFMFTMARSPVAPTHRGAGERGDESENVAVDRRHPGLDRRLLSLCRLPNHRL